MSLTKYQKFEPTTIHRAEIKNAPYNPRKISESNIKKLKKNIKEKGFFGGIVVNKTTMNLVSGHQRLAILDSLERKTDYELTVEMVSLTEKEEKEQNVFFNNPVTQGEFDELKLKDLFGNIDFQLAGFDAQDLAVFDIGMNEFGNKSEDIKEINNIKSVLREHKKKSREKNEMEGNTNFFIALVFETAEEKVLFCDRYKLDILEQYIKAKDFLKLLGIK
jgi:hypothetical protein